MSDHDMDHVITSTRRRVVIVGAALPLLIAAISAVLMVNWLPELPDPIAVHWSGAGPDGFGPALPFILASAVVVLVYCVFTIVMTWRISPSGLLSYSQKFLVVTGVWMSALLSIGFALSVASQRGLSDAHHAPDAGNSLAISAGVGVILAVGGWFVLPKGVVTPVRGESPKLVDIRGEEQLSWSHSARLSTTAFIIVGLTMLIAIGAVILASMSNRAISIFGVIIVVFVAVLVVSNTWWRVSADRRGFTVRSVLGWPSKRIPLDDIRTVQVSDVHPSRDFGGYGWRWSGNGRSGIILRAGKAMEITALSGNRFFVTVDDAETGVGVLAALLAQHATH